MYGGTAARAGQARLLLFRLSLLSSRLFSLGKKKKVLGLCSLRIGAQNKCTNQNSVGFITFCNRKSDWEPDIGSDRVESSRVSFERKYDNSFFLVYVH